MAEKIVLVYLARHGTTTLNASNCFRGNLNPSLDEQGFRDAHRLAFYFRSIELSHIFSSDKLRAMQTSKIIADAKKMEVIPNEQLRALNVGNFSGKERTAANLEALKHYIDNPTETIPGGESLADFQARVRPLFQDAMEIAADCGVPALIVGHSSLVHELGEAVNGGHETTLVKPGGCAALYCSNGELYAEPVFKPDLARMKQVVARYEVVS